MKKTLIALIAVAALPSFAEVVQSLDDVTPYSQGFNSGFTNDMLPGGKWWNANPLSVSSGLGYNGAKIGVYGSDQYSDYTMGGDQMSNFADGDWTIEFKVGNLSRPPQYSYTSEASFTGYYLFSISGTERTDGLTHSAALMFTIDGMLCWDTTIGGAGNLYGGNSVRHELTSITPMLETTGYTKFRFVSNTTENRFDVFVNDNLAYTIEGYNLNGEGLETIHFNGSPDDEAAGSTKYKMSTANAIIADINVWNVALDTTPPAVPEPATASLSLLGLAALMMRRRRA